MIQEKDFLYRVPVKTAPITTPGGQIRNPEILVDVEGGEFMHGNILDANSTNKLINQSVKDAVDNKLIESGYVTKDLLEAETTRATEQENSLKTLIDAETSARTKCDEDLSSKIKAEQTRAEGKEKEISDKLAIVNGDSNTEGSFRKAIADVIAAAPEDLDTLKEIADKLAGNDDLHTALNQAITEKADASALLNEVTRATSAESGLQAAIATKADATALSNYVLTAALNQQIDTLNTAISAKQDAGNYIPYDSSCTGSYQVNKTIAVVTNAVNTAVFGPNSCIALKSGDTNTMNINYSGVLLKVGDYSFTLDPSKIKQVGAQYAFDVNASDGVKFSRGESFAKITPLGFFSNQNDAAFTVCNANDFIYIKSLVNQIVRVQPTSLYCSDGTSSIDINSTGISLADGDDRIQLDSRGVVLPNGSYDYVLTSNGSTINIKSYATQSDLSSQLGPKADRSDLMALEQKVTANTTAIEGKQDKGKYMTYSSEYDNGYTIHWELTSSDPIIVENSNGLSSSIRYTGIFVEGTSIGSSSLRTDALSFSQGGNKAEYSVKGIYNSRYKNCLVTSDRSFKPISDFVLKEDQGIEYVSYDQFSDQIDSVKAGLSSKQNKITVNSVDVTNLETADITQLRAIVKDLLTALGNSGLIISSSGVE